jgi:hypothetical protein
MDLATVNKIWKVVLQLTARRTLNSEVPMLLPTVKVSLLIIFWITCSTVYTAKHRWGPWPGIYVGAASVFQLSNSSMKLADRNCWNHASSKYTVFYFYTTIIQTILDEYLFDTTLHRCTIIFVDGAKVHCWITRRYSIVSDWSMLTDS